jgi:hypothetical protein
MTDTDMLYMASLEKRNEELEAKVAELEGKHFVECTIISQYKAENRQLAEWLTELKEAKRLLKAAVEDLSCGGENNKCTKSCKTCTYNSIKGYGCRYLCEYHWRYADEALALIGEEGEQNG